MGLLDRIAAADIAHQQAGGTSLRQRTGRAMIPGAPTVELAGSTGQKAAGAEDPTFGTGWLNVITFGGVKRHEDDIFELEDANVEQVQSIIDHNEISDRMRHVVQSSARLQTQRTLVV